jgi:NTP pyrophosphatase (non-canonical NTP hydrolase)
MLDFDKLLAINRAYDTLYQGQDPFRIITRLAEECGELAKEVNHFEGTGRKREKHGPPSRESLAQEVQDVLRCALQVAAYYGVEQERAASVEATHARLMGEGRIKVS